MFIVIYFCASNALLCLSVRTKCCKLGLLLAVHMYADNCKCKQLLDLAVRVILHSFAMVALP